MSTKRDSVESSDKIQVKNYGIWLRYDSRTNTHNMYKEGTHCR